MSRPVGGRGRRRLDLVRVFALFAGFGLLAGASGSAIAASPDYCAVFAKQYAEKALAQNDGNLSPDRIHDRLYHKCLNMDEEPALPTAYAEPQTDGLGTAAAGDDALEALILEEATSESPSIDVTAIDEAVVKRTAAIEDDQRPAAPKRTGKWRGSGFATGSPEWRNWCAEHFPNSFDPNTGTILPYETGVREPCL